MVIGVGDRAAATKRVAIYLRVSSDDQAERGTIATQAAELDRWLVSEPDVQVVDSFSDEGVSGTIPLAERPAGRRLVALVEAGRVDEVWVYKFDRLGRDMPDMAAIVRAFERRGVGLRSRLEGWPGLLGYDIYAAVADHARRDFLRVTSNGLDEAARKGRYTGGIVPFGYRVEGSRETARLVPDREPFWHDRSAADLMVQIYTWLGLEGWSCRRVAGELNTLGVPTHYARDARLVKRDNRQQRTQGVWRAGRIRNMVVNPVYRGELQFGRRIDQRSERTVKRGHEIISASVAPLVSPELWQAAQDTLRANRAIPRNTHRRYLLRGAVRCGIDGLAYVGTRGRGDVAWYRCNGQIVERGPIPGRCWGQSIRADRLEPLIWGDIEAWLRNPGDVLAELEAEAADPADTTAMVDGTLLARRLELLADERARAIRLAVSGVLPEDDLRSELDRIDAERRVNEARIAEIEASAAELLDPAAGDLAGVIRGRLDAGLSDEDRATIVRLLAHVVIDTQTGPDGKKRATARIEYRFPIADEGVVGTRTGTDSSPRPTGSARGRSSPGPRARSRRGLPRVAAAAPPGLAVRIPQVRRGRGRPGARV